MVIIIRALGSLTLEKGVQYTDFQEYKQVDFEMKMCPVKIKRLYDVSLQDGLA